MGYSYKHKPWKVHCIMILNLKFWRYYNDYFDTEQIFLFAQERVEI